MNAPSPSASPEATPASSPAHVFVIVLENRSYAQVIGTSYIAQLAQQYGVASNYHGVSHPSLPNYLAMTSGSTFGITDDGWHNVPAGGLGGQLSTAGIEWRAYMEGMTGGCYRSPYPYALKHNPFAYYGGSCPSTSRGWCGSRPASVMTDTIAPTPWSTAGSPKPCRSS